TPAGDPAAARARQESRLRDSVRQLQLQQKAQRSTIDSARAANPKSPYGSAPQQQQQQGRPSPQAMMLDFPRVIARLTQSADSIAALRRAAASRTASGQSGSASVTAADTPTPSLTRVAFADSLRGWAAGEAGTFLRTD